MFIKQENLFRYMNAYPKFKEFMTGPEYITPAIFGIATILVLLLLIKMVLT